MTRLKHNDLKEIIKSFFENVRRWEKDEIPDSGLCDIGILTVLLLCSYFADKEIISMDDLKLLLKENELEKIFAKPNKKGDH